MTRRIIFESTDGKYWATPEYNGDKSELERFHSSDSCDADWPKILACFENVNILEEFRRASEKAQGMYHSCLGDEILDIEEFSKTELVKFDIADELYFVHAGKLVKFRNPALEAYLFSITRCHHRTGEHIGRTIGVVYAVSEEEAREMAWDMAGGDNACKLMVFPVPEEGETITVYKSSI